MTSHTCGPDVLTLGWKHQGLSSRFWAHNSMMFVCIVFASSCRHFATVYEATKSIIFYLASLLKRLPLVFRPLCPWWLCFTNLCPSELVQILMQLVSSGWAVSLHCIMFSNAGAVGLGISLVIAITEDRLGKNPTPVPLPFDLLASVEDMNPSTSFRTIIDQQRQCLKLEVLFCTEGNGATYPLEAPSYFSLSLSPRMSEGRELHLKSLWLFPCETQERNDET